ncbi:uncharacterized protein [Typha latifolia]|uniref:uncharacterized protein n=1 Tax=Typha latifolia TaxID=4733 RepID=UPI003C2F0189
MVSDSELVARLREFLRTSDLSTTTTAIVRRKLEEDFGVNLSDKKAFIREQVDLFLHSEFNNSDNPETEPEPEPEPEPEAKEEVKEEENGDNSGEAEEERASGEEEEEDEEEEEEEEEDESNGAGSRKRRLNKLNKEVKRRGGGFTKLCSLSPELQNFVGESELARTEVVKKLWAYIRENNLQDPNNKRKIICDERLRSLFNVNSIDMFQMNKALTKHIWPLASEDAGPLSPESSKSKDKRQKKGKNEGKRQKGGSSGLLIPIPLSNDLVKFIGTGENSLSRSDVVKRMWEYIKQNNLQDPADKRNILCDDKLKELLKVDSFNGFSVAKLLAPHFIKTKE